MNESNQHENDRENRADQIDTLEELQEKYPESLPTLIGVDGNAFSVMGHFRKNASRADWDREDIQLVLNIAMDGNYNHLLATIQRFTD